MKTLFIVFGRLSYGEKIKIEKKIVDTSFKYFFLSSRFLPFWSLQEELIEDQS